MCKDTQLVMLKQKYNTYIKYKMFSKAQEIKDKLKFIEITKKGERTLFNFKEPQEKDIILVSEERKCVKCSNIFYEIKGSRNHICIYCKLRDKKIETIERDFDFLKIIDEFEPQEKEQEKIKAIKRFCDTCNNRFYTTYTTRKQKCYVCKMNDGSISQAKKDLNRLFQSDLFTKSEEIKK